MGLGPHSVTGGSTDVSCTIYIANATTGAPETSVEHNTSGIDLWYRREGAAKTSITEASLSALTDAHSDGGIEAISNGTYRLDLPDAAVAAGVAGVQVGGTITGMVVYGPYITIDPPVNVTKVSGDATAADTLELFVEALDQATGQLDSGSLANNTITAASIAADAITAAKIANGAIDAATFAADVDAEILSYIVDDATRIDASALNTASGTTIPAILEDTGTTLQAELDGIQADTEDIQTRLPAALIGGRIDATVDGTGMESGAINAIIEACFTYDATATYAGADAGSLVKQIADNAGGSGLTEAGIAAAVWEEELAGYVTPGEAGYILGNVATGTPPTASAIADEVQTRTIAAVTTVTTTTNLTNLPTIPNNWITAAGVAADVTTELQSGLATAAALASLVTTVGVAGAGLTEAGGDGDHLTAINLPNQTMDIVGNITGNLSGSVGSVTGAVGSVTGNVTGSVGSLATQAKADVNAEVLDVLNVDTFAEPTGVPGATTTLRNMLGFVYSFGFRNKITVDASKMTFFGDDDAAEFEKDVSDDGTTYTESEANSV
jgi:hypothetical protein